MRLLLIRHGQTPSNVLGALDTGYPGPGLTPLGRAQADAVPGALADEGIDRVYASPLTRAHHTANPLGDDRGLEVGIREGLEEIPAGDLEMREDAASVRTYGAALVHWMHGDLDHRLPGGESGHDFYTRYDTALRRITGEHGPDDTLAVFSHGAAIRVYVALAARLDPAVAVDLRIMNTGMGLLEGHPDSGWTLTRWADEPLGGLALEDALADDPTGESAEEALHETDA